MSLNSPIARSLEEQSSALIAFLAAQQHILTETNARGICSTLPVDPKRAAKQLRDALVPLGIDIKHTHALKAIAVARDADGFLGLNSRAHYEVASWSPDAPGVSAERKTFKDFAAAASEVCTRVRDQYEDDEPFGRLRCRANHLLLSLSSHLTGSDWHVMLVPTNRDGSAAAFDSPTEVERFAERTRRLVEGELRGWLDGMFDIGQAFSKQDAHALVADGRPETGLPALLGLKPQSTPDELPESSEDADWKAVRAPLSVPDWGAYLKRYRHFAERHDVSLFDWTGRIREEVAKARFEPTKLNIAKVEMSRIQAGMSWDDIGTCLAIGEGKALEEMRAGLCDLKHVEVLARQLKVEDPNDLLAHDRPSPRIPLPLYTDIAMWLSRLDAMVSESAGAPAVPRNIVARLSALCAMPYETRRRWDKQPPPELEALNQEIRFAGLMVCAGMGIRFLRDLPLGWTRPASLSLFEFDRQVDVLTQGGQLGPHNGMMSIPPERDPVTPEWLARFNKPKFTAKDLLRYSDMVEQMREPDGDWKSRFHTQAYAGVKVFKRDAEKAHSASIRMEALSHLIEASPMGPWVRRGAGTDGSMMLSEAAFQAAARCELIDVAGRPGFDGQQFYMLCVKHARKYA